MKEITFILQKKTMKLFYSLICLILFTNILHAASLHGLDGREQLKIDVVKNARQHNNMGNIYFDEKNYNAAFLEYQIAYGLTKNTHAGAAYVYNMARCAMKFGNYKQAQHFIEQAINKDCINMTYYEALVDCYIAQNIVQKKLSHHIADTKNPYNRIVAGLIYLKTGQKIDAKIIFDEFINDNPDMIISDDVRQILKNLND